MLKKFSAVKYIIPLSIKDAAALMSKHDELANGAGVNL